MANPQLVAYIKENSAQFPKETLTQSLVASGWQMPDIADAFAEIEHPAPLVAPVAVPIAPPVVPQAPAPIVVTPPVPTQVPVMPVATGTPAPIMAAPPVIAPVQPTQVPPVVVQPAASITPPVRPIITPVQITPAAPTATTAQPAANDFIVQMEKRRKEAEAAHPLQNMASNSTQSVQFNETSGTTEKGIVGMLIQMKIAKDANQANIIMIGVAGVCIVISAWFLWPSSGPSATPSKGLPPPVPGTR